MKLSQRGVASPPPPPRSPPASRASRLEALLPGSKPSREQAAARQRDEKIQSLEEQLRDLIVHIEAQKTVDDLPGSSSGDAKGGTVLPVPAAAAASSSSSPTKSGGSSRRAARNRKG